MTNEDAATAAAAKSSLALFFEKDYQMLAERAAVNFERQQQQQHNGVSLNLTYISINKEKVPERYE